MLIAEALRLARGGRKFGRPIDLHLNAGEALCVMGANGSGKTTLLRIVADLIHQARKVKIAPQNTIVFMGHKPGVYRDLSVEAQLAHFSFLYHYHGAAFDPLFAQPNILKTRVGNLSFGQQKRLGLEGCLRSGATLWVFDEPWSGLDEASRGHMTEAVLGHLLKGGAMLFSSHEAPAFDCRILQL